MIVKEDGISKPIFKKGFNLIGSGENYVVGSNSKGDISLLNKDGKELISINISSQGLTATFNERDLLGVLTAKNELIIVDTLEKKIVFKHKEKLALTSTSDIATPIFYDSLILFPTLGGKLIIVDEKTKTIGRDFIVSTEKFFSNISYLNIYKGRAIVGTSDKIISVGGDTLESKKSDTRFLITDNEKLFILSIDGKITHVDKDLRDIDSIKFPFARFAGVSQTKDKLIVLEHSGYIIVLDKDLKSYKTYETPDNFDDFFFLDGMKFYYGNKLIDLAKIN